MGLGTEVSVIVFEVVDVGGLGMEGSGMLQVLLRGWSRCSIFRQAVIRTGPKLEFSGWRFWKVVEQTGGLRYETTGTGKFLTGHYTKRDNIFLTNAACVLTVINEDRRTSRLCQPQIDVFNL